MAECPRCSQPISHSATTCACGWRSRKKEPAYEAPREIVQCAHEVCSVPAVCKVKTPTGWANFCMPHYERYHEAGALKGLAEKGLDQRPGETRAEHVGRMRAWFKANAKLRTFRDVEIDAQRAEDEWAA